MPSAAPRAYLPLTSTTCAHSDGLPHSTAQPSHGAWSPRVTTYGRNHLTEPRHGTQPLPPRKRHQHGPHRPAQRIELLPQRIHLIQGIFARLGQVGRHKRQFFITGIARVCFPLQIPKLQSCSLALEMLFI